MMGASAPDYLEVNYGPHGGRRLITHRTWTHQPLLWLAATAALLFLYWQRTPYHLFALAWLCSGLLHLSMDLLTPMGIPLGLPWGKRTSVTLYRTGGSEWPIVIVVWLIAIGPYVWPHVRPWRETLLAQAGALFSAPK